MGASGSEAYASTSGMGAADENLEAAAFVGRTVAGKYRVDRVIGIGGMGFVVAATHLHIDEPVALKVLYSGYARKEDVVQRFMREAKAARKIRSEHVVKVLDVGTMEDGAPYIVMEHLNGQDLEQVLRRMGRQPLATALDVILQAGEALAEAHVQKMVHRDLKPANLFVTRRPDGDALVKVLDFGISKVTGTDGADLGFTKDGDALLGSPQYMAPEQLTSLRDVDARTDIWGLGAILYEMLTATPAFNSPSLPELFSKILVSPPDAPLRALRPDVPPGIEAAILKCLEKKREDRFQDMSQLANALAPFCPPSVQASATRIGGVFRTAMFATGMPMSSPVPSGLDPRSAQGHPRRSATDTAPVVSPRIEGPPQRPTPMPPPPPRPFVATTGNAFAKDRASGRPPAAGPSAPPAVIAAVLGGIALAVALLAVFVVVPRVRTYHATPADSLVATPPPPPTPIPEPLVSASGVPSAKPTPDCAEPYTVDAEGNKLWKRECF